MNKEEVILKRQVRHGVFETNSSSVHSITMCSETEYNEFENGNIYIEKWGSDLLYTKEELIKKFKQAIDWRTKKLKYSGVDWDNEKEFKRVLEESNYCTCDEYWNTVSRENKTFVKSYECKNGEKIIAFGYYGYDY